MTQPGTQRMVWATGLLAYLAGGLFFLFTVFWVPFVGAIVLLACASATGIRRRDDMLVMAAASLELAIGVFLSLLLSGSPRWLAPFVAVSSVVGLLLPIVVIGYRMARPRIVGDGARPEGAPGDPAAG